jgi:hypothetical protein
MTDREIQDGRKHDQWNRKNPDKGLEEKPDAPKTTEPQNEGFWKKLRGFFD